MFSKSWFFYFFEFSLFDSFIGSSVRWSPQANIFIARGIETPENWAEPGIVWVGMQNAARGSYIFVCGTPWCVVF